MRSAALRLLFSALKDAGYEWQPQTPDRLLAFRKSPEPFRPLVRFFGLGLAVTKEELIGDGLGIGVLGALESTGLARDATRELDTTVGLLAWKSTMAVSGAGDLFVVHDHWPPDLEEKRGYVHYAAESAWLGRVLANDLEGFIDKKILDLGCSSGALSFEVCVVADRVLGLDISARAVECARDSAAAYGFKNAYFEVAAVGSKEGDAAAAAAAPWDVVVMNPPMVVPSKDVAYPHRDGGKLGIELPLRFLDFAHRHLKTGGEVLTFATNPIVNGRNAFFDELPRGNWELIEKRCVQSHFNQAVARKQGYGDQGIERVELWFLHLAKI